MNILICYVDHPVGKEYGVTYHCEDIAKELASVCRTSLQCRVQDLLQPTKDEMVEAMKSLCSTAVIFSSMSSDSGRSDAGDESTNLSNSLLILLTSGSSLDQQICTDDGYATMEELSQISPNILLDIHMLGASVTYNKETMMSTKHSPYASLTRNFVRFLLEEGLTTNEKSNVHDLLRRFRDWRSIHKDEERAGVAPGPIGEYSPMSVQMWVPATPGQAGGSDNKTPRPQLPKSGRPHSRASAAASTPALVLMCSFCSAKASDVPVLVCMKCPSYVVCGTCYHSETHEHDLFKRIDPPVKRSTSSMYKPYTHQYDAGQWFHGGCAHKECGGETRTAAVLFDTYLTYLRQQLVEEGNITAESLPPGQTVDVPHSITEYLKRNFAAHTQGAFRTNRGARFTCVDESSTELLYSYLYGVKCFRSVSCSLKNRQVDVRILDGIEALHMFREADSRWIETAAHEVSIVVHVPKTWISHLRVGVYDIPSLLVDTCWDIISSTMGYPEGIKHLEFKCSKHRHVTRHATELVIRPRGGKECVPYWPCVVKQTPQSPQKKKPATPSVDQILSTRARSLTRSKMSPALLESNWNSAKATGDVFHYRWAEDEHLKKYKSKWISKFPVNPKKAYVPPSKLMYHMNADIRTDFILTARKLFLQIPGYTTEPAEIECAKCDQKVYLPPMRLAVLGALDTLERGSFVFTLQMLCQDSNLAVHTCLEEVLQLISPNRAAVSTHCSFLMFVTMLLLRVQDLETVRVLRERYDTWAAPRLSTRADGINMRWFDPLEFLLNTIPFEQSLNHVQRLTLSLGNGRDFFPAILFATMGRGEQVKFQRCMPDLIYDLHVCKKKSSN